MIKNRHTRGFWDWVNTGNWNGNDANTGVGG